MDTSFDSQSAITTIRRFLTGSLMQSGLSGYVVGLSGGIDSALSATLAVEAIGPDKVFGVLMPYKLSSASSLSDARALVAQLEIEHTVVDISPMIDAYYDRIDESMQVRAGNKMARERMSILFDIAFDMNRLVLGTGNRTESALGYTTLYGDQACSVNPIGELYKTQVRQLARELEVPESIITKPPSADLWVDQTDEGEIGVTYDEIDRILVQLLDENVRSMKILEADGLDSVSVSRVVSMLNRNSFKRRQPPVAPLGKPPIPEHIELDQ
ncbi:NAD+ synthase [candidate division GN15 bacterium]|nr:NAD+ synthase [candidate division GN15 bacterium]